MKVRIGYVVRVAGGARFFVAHVIVESGFPLLVRPLFIDVRGLLPRPDGRSSSAR